MLQLRCWHVDHSLPGLLRFAVVSDAVPNDDGPVADALRRCELIVQPPGLSPGWSPLVTDVRRGRAPLSAALREAAFRVPLFAALVQRFGPTSVPPELAEAFLAALGYPAGRCASTAIAWFSDVRAALVDLDRDLVVDVPFLQYSEPASLPQFVDAEIPFLPEPEWPAPLPSRHHGHGTGMCWRCGAPIDTRHAQCTSCRRTLVLTAQEFHEARYFARRFDGCLAHKICMLCQLPLAPESGDAAICCSPRCTGRYRRFLHSARLAFPRDAAPRVLPLPPDLAPISPPSAVWPSLDGAVRSDAVRRGDLAEQFAALVLDADTDVFAVRSRCEEAGLEVSDEPFYNRTDSVVFRAVPSATVGVRRAWRATVPGAAVSLRVRPLSVRPSVHHSPAGEMSFEHYPLWAFDARVGPHVDTWRVVVEVSAESPGVRLVRDPYRGPGFFTAVHSVVDDFSKFAAQAALFLDAELLAESSPSHLPEYWH